MNEKQVIRSKNKRDFKLFFLQEHLDYSFLARSII